MRYLCAKITATSMRSIVSGMTNTKDVAFFALLCLKTTPTREDLYVIFDNSPMIVTKSALLANYTPVGGHTELKPTMIWFPVEEKDAVDRADADRDPSRTGGG